MVWFYSRGADTRTCETRLAVDSQGYELIVTDAEGVHVERFDELANLLAREHELSTYDACYLELAERMGLPLATLDSDLRKAASSAGVQLVD